MRIVCCDLVAPLRVLRVMAVEKNSVRTQASCSSQWHRRLNAVLSCFVTGRGDYATLIRYASAHHDRLSYHTKLRSSNSTETKKASMSTCSIEVSLLQNCLIRLEHHASREIVLNWHLQLSFQRWLERIWTTCSRHPHQNQNKNTASIRKLIFRAGVPQRSRAECLQDRCSRSPPSTDAHPAAVELQERLSGRVPQRKMPLLQVAVRET